MKITIKVYMPNGKIRTLSTTESWLPNFSGAITYYDNGAKIWTAYLVHNVTDLNQLIQNDKHLLENNGQIAPFKIVKKRIK